MIDNELLTLIKQMHSKFGISNDKQTLLSEEEKTFRVACLKEEIREFEESETMADSIDALIDLCVFAIGTVERMGCLEIFEECFKRVMTANMSKSIGNATKEREGTKSFQLDLVKPVDFKAPNFDDLIR